MDQEHEVSEMFITSLGNLIELESTPHSQADHTLEYGLLNQPITARKLLAPTVLSTSDYGLAECRGRGP